jgi:hypothetical protein
LKGFHIAFHSFCKDYFPSECLYENCCEEFSSLHESSAGPEDHVYDEAFTVEESICYENIEVLNDINFVSPRIESSDIISDASVLLDVSVRSHSWIATGAEPNAHQFMSRINLMGDQMGRDPGRYHSNSGTRPGM